MSLRERVARLLAGNALDEAIKVAVREAVATIDPDEHLWRGAGQSRRDLPSYTLTEAQDMAYTLYQRNALGHRLTELAPDFIVGDGITWSSTNPAVAEVVEDWWNDDVNRWELRQHDFALELGLYGELFPEALTGEVSGVMQLGYVDPGQVKRVQMVSGNSMVPDVLIVKRGRGETLREEPLQVIRDRGNGYLEGDVFVFQVNSVSNSTRGWPDLMHVVDWLDIYDQMLWEMAERARLARSFIWDVEIEGDDAAVKQWLRDHGDTPRSGSIRAHNKGVQWNAVAPQLGSFETAEEADVQLSHIAAAMGFPKHWLSSAADVNRATAQEMGAPTSRKLGRRQAYYLGCIRRMIRYVVEQACRSGRITNTDGFVQVYDTGGQALTTPEGDKVQMPAWRTVRLHAPEVSPRDAYRAGQLLLQLTNALALAEESGWFGKQTSRRALATAFAQMGVETDPNEEMATDAEEEPPQQGAPVRALPTQQAQNGGANGQRAAARGGRGRQQAQ